MAYETEANVGRQRPLQRLVAADSIHQVAHDLHIGVWAHRLTKSVIMFQRVPLMQFLPILCSQTP
eukprot:5239537-Lingulodinium_polyedra.AAC.1